jgi:IS4 transposase
LCLAIYDWATYRKAKGAVKLHLNLDGDTLLPYDAYLTKDKVHDVHGMARLCDESGVIYVLDGGISIITAYNIELQGSTFVTRMKRGGAFKRIMNNVRDQDGPIRSDVVIRLTGSKTKKHYPKPLRKIKYYDKEYHHTYECITNNFEMAEQNRADLYQRRWQVELCFKWIK